MSSESFSVHNGKPFVLFTLHLHVEIPISIVYREIETRRRHSLPYFKLASASAVPVKNIQRNIRDVISAANILSLHYWYNVSIAMYLLL
jgi:hypothetical protein